jgi:hypothetical protein
MQKILITIFFLLAVNGLTGCAGWTINGHCVQNIKNLTTREYAEIATGVAASFAVHWLGHVIYFQANGIEWRQDGLMEKATQPISGNQLQWVGRAGFLTQLMVGIGIEYAPWKLGYFKMGYHLGTAAEIATYPAVHKDKGDLQAIGNSKDAEWSIFSTASLLLLNKAAASRF